MELPVGDWGEHLRWSLGNADAQAVLARQARGMAALHVWYDNDGLWDWGDPRGDGPRQLQQMVDQYAAVGAAGVVWGCGNNLAWSYAPRVQEWWCDRVVATEPGLAHLAARQRQWRASGLAPLDIVAARAQSHRLPVLAGFRLNRYFVSHGVESWFTAHPQFVLPARHCPLAPTQQSLNLAAAEVRQHLAATALDVVAQLPVSGLHLELMRAIPFFAPGQADKQRYLTDFLIQLRTGLDRLEQQRGTRLELSLWSGTEANYQVIRRGLFPPEFMALEFHGIDLEGWIAAGLVDRLMLSCWSGGPGRRGAPVNLLPWVRAAHGTGTRILGEFDNVTEVPDPLSLAEAERHLREVAALTDGLYLFNTPPASLALLLDQAARPQGRPA